MGLKKPTMFEIHWLRPGPSPVFGPGFRTKGFRTKGFRTKVLDPFAVLQIWSFQLYLKRSWRGLESIQTVIWWEWRKHWLLAPVLYTRKAMLTRLERAHFLQQGLRLQKHSALFQPTLCWSGEPLLKYPATTGDRVLTQTVLCPPSHWTQGSVLGGSEAESVEIKC